VSDLYRQTIVITIIVVFVLVLNMGQAVMLIACQGPIIIIVSVVLIT
jgi:hypothetical protein